MQQLAGFNPSNGDAIDLVNILQTTLAHANLSDVGNYVTAAISSAGTTLYFDPTGRGLQGTPFAVLQGVDTTVAQLAADGGLKYDPVAIALKPTFNTPFTLRPDGLETVNLLAPAPGVGPQQIFGFNPAKSDLLQLQQILDPTTALANLSNVGHYISVTQSAGNTILSLDVTATGQPGTPFAELMGVTLTLPQLLADNALVYTPSATTAVASANATFVFRPEGDETAALTSTAHNNTPPLLQGFSLADGDAIGVHNLLVMANINVPTSALGNYFSTTASNGSTSLWFNPAGTGGGGSVVATLQNTVVSISALLAKGALVTGAPVTLNPTPALGTVTPIMHMGCTNKLITYRSQGEETICLESAPNGTQRLAGFNAAKGDVIGVDDVLEQTPAATNLSDVGKYITSQISSAGTTLYFDPTGNSEPKSAIAVLQGVDTTVAQLVADGGMQYVPDAVTVTPTYNTPLTMRPAGLETVDLLPTAPGAGTQQINGFNPDLADVLQLRQILNGSNAAPDLSNVQNYVSAATSGGNTILSVDDSGTGQPGVAFAQLNGVSVTLAQLLTDNALTFTPSAVRLGAPGGQTFTFRPEGDEVAEVPENPAHSGYATLQGFSTANGDALGLANILNTNNVHTSLANLGDYISAQQNGGSLSLWLDPTGSGHGGGTEFALLQNTTGSFASLAAANAFKLV